MTPNEQESVNKMGMFETQLQYSVSLQRAIEYHCDNKMIPESIASECPHHAKMLNEYKRNLTNDPKP